MKPGRPLRSIALLSSALALAACGDNDDDDGGGGLADAAASIDSGGGGGPADAGGDPDAMAADLSCLGNPLPTEAANPVTISGAAFAIDATGQEPVEGAVVQLRRAANDRVMDTNGPAGTGADGAYALTGRTRGVPLEAYLRATADGLVPTRLFPPMPVVADLEMVPLPMFSPIVINFVAPDQEPENGIVLVIVLDCSGAPVAGATVGSTPEAGEVVYAGDNGIPDSSATSTGSTGLAFLINVPPGAVEVGASASGQDFLAHQVASVGEEVTTTVVMPGPPGP